MPFLTEDELEEVGNLRSSSFNRKLFSLTTCSRIWSKMADTTASPSCSEHSTAEPFLGVTGVLISDEAMLVPIDRVGDEALGFDF